MVYLLLGAIALANAGCLALAVGGAAGGAAAGYAIYKRAEWYRDYPASMNDSAVAVRTALGELKLPIVDEKHDDSEIRIDSRTGDDATIHITLTPVVSRIPADGATTHIVIRVGALGDETLSTRIHEQVSLHLVAPVQMHTATTPMTTPTTSASLPPPPRETAPPPLAK
jgi:hypothetical protein